MLRVRCGMPQKDGAHDGAQDGADGNRPAVRAWLLPLGLVAARVRSGIKRNICG